MKISEVIQALTVLKAEDPEVYISFRRSSFVYGGIDYGYYEGKVDTITFDGKDCIVRICADMLDKVG